MDDNVRSVLHKVIQLSKQNEEFDKELRKALNILPSAKVVTGNDHISKDISAIREALEIRANASITYDFVQEQRLHDQLIIDNLRMENAALNLKQSERERFYSFCVNAFYQIENIVNYYFHSTFKKVDDMFNVIEKYTEQEQSDDFKFRRKGRERNVGDIPVAHKINAFCNIFFPGDKFKMTLGQLRQVRNEGEHRCMIIMENKDEKNNLYNFFKYNTFNTIRIYLIRFVNAIKENINKPIVEEQTKVEAEVTSLLPSACYIKFNNKTVALPDKLVSKAKGLKVGDQITVILSRDRIMDITFAGSVK